ncbi:hypothetical protein L218DRAFT_1081398 [Marasmius fiardii PR-910]|nr:hypothetical protein L218DRAFT_1081398 [Marasmius fiardii PR-910]
MSIFDAPMFRLIRSASRTRDHFSKAVEMIKLCRELQYNAGADYSDPEQVARLHEIISKAEEALKTAIKSPSSPAPFQDFCDAVIEKYSGDQAEILQEFNGRWKQAERQDGRKKDDLKKAVKRVQEGSSGEREILISVVTDPDVKFFNYTDVPDTYKTTVIVKCRQTDTIDGLLWLLTRNRLTPPAAGATARINIGDILYSPYFYNSETLKKFGDSTRVKYIDPIGPDIPQDRCRLQLLWDRKPPFYFRVVFLNSPLISYGNIWRLKDLDNSPFVLKEIGSGRLTLSTEVVRHFKHNTRFRVLNPAEVTVDEFEGRVHEDFARVFFDKVLDNDGDSTSWILEPAHAPIRFPQPIIPPFHWQPAPFPAPTPPTTFPLPTPFPAPTSSTAFPLHTPFPAPTPPAPPDTHVQPDPPALAVGSKMNTIPAGDLIRQTNGSAPEVVPQSVSNADENITAPIQGPAEHDGNFGINPGDNKPTLNEVQNSQNPSIPESNPKLPIPTISSPLKDESTGQNNASTGDPLPDPESLLPGGPASGHKLSRFERIKNRVKGWFS